MGVSRFFHFTTHPLTSIDIHNTDRGWGASTKGARLRNVLSKFVKLNAGSEASQENSAFIPILLWSDCTQINSNTAYKP